MTDPKRGLGDEFNELWDDLMHIMETSDEAQYDEFVRLLEARLPSLKAKRQDETGEGS